MVETSEAYLSFYWIINYSKKREFSLSLAANSVGRKKEGKKSLPFTAGALIIRKVFDLLTIDS